MTREEMWKEFEKQLIRETRTPITVSYDVSERMIKSAIEETVAKWKERLEQEPCENAISRQDTLKTIIKHLGIRSEEYLLPAEEAIYKVVKNMPSITPQQKVGKWIRIDKDKLKCSECEVIHYIAQYPQSANINYCPNCGTKMEVEE